jgi:hypothetical protein
MSARKAAPSRAPAPRGSGAAIPWLLAALVAAAYAHVFRMGYFADDFLFLDAVSRKPFGEVLLGWHGVWPWYRPLSRELFFALAHAAGTAGPALAHAVALVALWVAADALWRVLARRASPAVAAIAVALLLCHSVLFFLAGWLSGFQDLLALALTLLALRLQQDGRLAAATIAAALAPLAKESGFLALPLLALDVTLGERRAPARREWLAWLAAGAFAALVHVLARATWPKLAQPVPELVGVARGWPVILRALSPWTSPPGPAGAGTWIEATLAAGIVFVLLGMASRTRREEGASAPLAWLAAALLLGALPGVAPMLSPRLPQQAHYYVAALPWACALVALLLARVPMLARVLVPLACGSFVWAGVARTVDLDAPQGWAIAPLGWSDAQRVEARTRRLEDDVRRLLANRPESLLVGYLHVPSGAWFQTEDGPATRIALGDRTVTARMARELPSNVLANERVPLALLDFDPVTTHHLVSLRSADPQLGPRAVQQVLAGSSARGRAMALYALRSAPEENVALLRYLAAVATLQEDGDRAAFARQVRGIGGALAVPRDHDGPGLVAAAAQPLSAPAHAGAAARLAATPLLAALELSVAVELDSARAGDALHLARLLAPKMPDAAARAYAVATRPGAPGAIADSARAEAAALAAR